MQTNLLFKGFGAAQAQTPVESREYSAFDAEFVIVHGWRRGYSAIRAMKLLRGFGYGLKEAKQLAERFMVEEKVRVAVPDYVRADVAAERLEELCLNATAEKIKIVHVIPRKGRWAVKNQGAAKATKLFKSKTEASLFATKLAKKHQPGRIIVHNRDGEIKSIRTFNPERNTETSAA